MKYKQNTKLCDWRNNIQMYSCSNWSACQSFRGKQFPRSKNKHGSSEDPEFKIARISTLAKLEGNKITLSKNTAKFATNLTKELLKFDSSVLMFVMETRSVQFAQIDNNKETCESGSKFIGAVAKNSLGHRRTHLAFPKVKQNSKTTWSSVEIDTRPDNSSFREYHDRHTRSQRLSKMKTELFLASEYYL